MKLAVLVIILTSFLMACRESKDLTKQYNAIPTAVKRDTILIHCEQGKNYPYNWNDASCTKTTERAHNIHPTIQLTLTKNGGPLSGQRVWVSEPSGFNILSEAALGNGTERDPINGLYMITDGNGSAVLRLHFNQANFTNPGYGQGYRNFTFTYVPQDTINLIVQKTIEVRTCRNCTDCNDDYSTPSKEKREDIEEARIHLRWALGERGRCSQWVKCALWNRVIIVADEPMLINRTQTSARDQVLIALAIVNMPDLIRNMIQMENPHQNLIDLAFDLILSTQIHDDGIKTQDWMKNHRDVVMEALNELEPFEVLTNQSPMGYLHDMFPGVRCRS